MSKLNQDIKTGTEGTIPPHWYILGGEKLSKTDILDLDEFELRLLNLIVENDVIALIEDRFDDIIQHEVREEIQNPKKLRQYKKTADKWSEIIIGFQDFKLSEKEV
tara:strand:- start:250 stop:567 length:318 start_codon:yes stop_codon:yes gene_type:complete